MSITLTELDKQFQILTEKWMEDDEIGPKALIELGDFLEKLFREGC